MRLWVYIVRRCVLLLPVIIGVATITFVLVSTLPIVARLTAEYGSPPVRNPWIYDPTEPCGPVNATKWCYNPTYYRYLDSSGLNDSIPVQWAIYMGRVFTGHWGIISNASAVAFAYPAAADQPVTMVLGWLLPSTLELVAFALVLLLATALPLGRLAAAHRNEPADHAVRALSFGGFALPTYLLGSLLILVIVLGLGGAAGYMVHPPWCTSGDPLATELVGSWPLPRCFPGEVLPSWLPNGLTSSPTGFPTVDAFLNGDPWLGFDTVLRLVLPAAVIAFAHLGLILRYVRNSSLESMHQEYIRTARAEGIPERTIVRRHVGKNAMALTTTVLAVSLATFFGWLPIVETVFGLQGVGLLVALSAEQPIDFAGLTGSVLLIIFMVVVANLVADVVLAYLDPRVRLGGRMPS